jgi:hypothetical protein
MATKKEVKDKRIKKPKTSTKRILGVSEEKMKKREEASLIRTISRYEQNLTNLITNSYEKERPTFITELLMIALFPQLQNATNIHHYKEYFMLLQTDSNFREKVYSVENEYPYMNMDKQLHHFALYPLLHQKLLEIVRDCVNGGYTKKIATSLRKITSEAVNIGDK